MRHELIDLLNQAILYQESGQRTMMATVVALEGSSYRRPGVRMLLTDQGQMHGAVSGGCVEKEVLRRARSVFQTGIPEVMTYDGRYRLGCEGLLYILLEPLMLSASFISAFSSHLHERNDWIVRSAFRAEDGFTGNMGSTIDWGKHEPPSSFSTEIAETPDDEYEVFSQTLPPRFQLCIIGAEHDSVAVTRMASQLGWEVEVVSPLSHPARPADFPDATRVLAESPETMSFEHLDTHSAVLLMTHNYALDHRYLLGLISSDAAYIGVLGSVKRSHRIQNELMDAMPDIPMEFWDRFHSPAGLHIGSETPEEIALSMLAEIMAVTRKKSAAPLKESKGSIHEA